jgi:hypothetical protein
MISEHNYKLVRSRGMINNKNQFVSAESHHWLTDVRHNLIFA